MHPIEFHQREEELALEGSLMGGVFDLELDVGHHFVWNR